MKYSGQDLLDMRDSNVGWAGSGRESWWRAACTTLGIIITYHRPFAKSLAKRFGQMARRPSV